MKWVVDFAMKAGEVQSCSQSSDVMSEKLDGNHDIKQHLENNMNGNFSKYS